LPGTLSRRLLAETTWCLATVGVTSPRREPFIPIEQTPAGHTSADIPVGGFGDFPVARSPASITPVWAHHAVIAKRARQRQRTVALQKLRPNQAASLQRDSVLEGGSPLPFCYGNF